MAETSARPAVPISFDETDVTPYEVAIKNNSAPFVYLVDINRMMRSDEVSVYRFFSKYYEGILKAFESKWGEIHYCLVNDSNALVLTKKGYMFHEETQPDVDSLALIHRCDALQSEAHRLLETKSRGSGLDTDGRASDLFTCMSMVTELLSHLYASLEELSKNGSNAEEQKKKEEEHKKLVEYLKKELDLLDANFVRCARRRARYEYTGGMFQGLGWAILFSIAASVGLLAIRVETSTVALFLGSLCLGGVGAIISVMTRMSNVAKEEFAVDHDAGPDQNRRLGLYRPVIGATMGLIVYFLMMSGLLALQVPGNAEARFFFVLIISFSAGFTERWAQDLLPGAKEQKTG